MIHILKVKELEGNPPNTRLTYQTINIIMKRIPQISCSIPAQIQIITGYHQGDCCLNVTTPTDITYHYQILQTFSTGTHMEEENALFYMDIDFSVKRLIS